MALLCCHVSFWICFLKFSVTIGASVILLSQVDLFLFLLMKKGTKEMGIVQINGNNNGRNKIFFHSERPHLFCVRTI